MIHTESETNKTKDNACDSSEGMKEGIKRVLSTDNMRRFIILDRHDTRKILRYLAFGALVMVVTLFLLRFTRDDFRKTAENISKLNPAYTRHLEPLKNFHLFPCYPHLMSSLSLKWHGKCVRTINYGAMNFGIRLDEHCQFIPIDKKPQICTYKPHRRNESLFINQEGQRNKQQIETMLKVLANNKKMYFFDVSMGDGEYCIAAAHHTNRSICMNGNFKTVMMLVKSVIISRTVDNIRFVWNILRDKHETVTQKYYDVKLNVTSDDVNLKTFIALSRTSLYEYNVNSVTLDDLIGIFKGRPVFMKLDLDHTDVSVFLTGDRFFRLVDLRILQIVTDDKNKALRTAELLGYHKFFPYDDPVNKRHLQKKAEWPRNVYFMK